MSGSKNNTTPHLDKWTYVIVHGSTGGGWDWKGVDRLLTRQGHEVYRPTLTGLGERSHLSSPAIGLATHIDDIINVIRFEALQRVVLVGHSYGGMVISGVMEKIPDRIKHAVFLDAYLPDDGESFMDFSRKYGDQTPRPVTNGIYVATWINPNVQPPCDVPQSYKTLTDPVSFKNPAAHKIPATCVLFVEKVNRFQFPKKLDAFHELQMQRAQARRWPVKILNSDHNAQRSHPRELVKLLEQAPRDQTIVRPPTSQKTKKESKRRIN